MTGDPVTPLDRLAGALADRHLAALSRPQFLKAARALSARYVEGRQSLPTRSPIDSAGKRAAFALLFGPLHYAVTEAVVGRLGLANRPIRRIADLGCGTGTASAAWALAGSRPLASVAGVDVNAWAVAEAGWTWTTLGLHGRARRGDLVIEAGRLSASNSLPLTNTGILLAWAVNELSPDARGALLDRLLRLGRRGATVLVIEPLARRSVPWWDGWARTISAAGGRDDEWRLPNRLPAILRQLDRDAGFDRPDLSARTLLLPPNGDADTHVLRSASNG